MFTEQLRKTYYNLLIKPERLAKYLLASHTHSQIDRQTDRQVTLLLFFRDLRLLVLEPHRWSVVQKLQVLVKGLTLDDLLTFVSRLKEELYVEGLVQGNYTSTVREGGV